MIFSTSGGPAGGEDLSLAGSPISLKKPSKPLGATMPRNLAGVVPAFLKVCRVPLGMLTKVPAPTTLALSEPETGAAFRLPQPRMTQVETGMRVDGEKSLVTNG